VVDLTVVAGRSSGSCVATITIVVFITTVPSLVVLVVSAATTVADLITILATTVGTRSMGLILIDHIVVVVESP
jgi:hypothetical protein